MTWGVRSFTPAEWTKDVVIVGGGPAGMEAARVAALRGHRVRLYERRAALGGAYGLIGRLPGREDAMEAPRWYNDRLAELGVRIMTRTEATAEAILAHRPDAVVLAPGAGFDPTGTTGFIAEPIPGWDQPFVLTPERVLDGDIPEGDRALVLDEEGQSTGAGIAELFAARGMQVELATRWQLVAPRLQANGQFAFVLARLYAAGVTLSPNTYIKEIGGNRAVTLFNIFTNEERVVEGVSMVVLVARRRPEAALYEALAGRVPELHLIGDGATPRTLFEASYEGHRIGREI
jgi:hypothetical protein